MSTQDETATRSSIDEPIRDDDQPAETGGEAATDTEQLSLDIIFEILKNSRRREVLHHLRDHGPGERVSLGELAEHVAAIENDTTTDALTSSQRKRVYVGLYQCHLPKMDDMGVIEFNKPRGTVVLGDNMEVMYNYLETATADTEPDWHRYSTFLSVGGAVILSTALLVNPMTTLPVIDLSVVGLLAAFLVYGFVCARWSRNHD